MNYKMSDCHLQKVKLSFTGNQNVIDWKSNPHSQKVRLSVTGNKTVTESSWRNHGSNPQPVGQSAVYKHYSATTTPRCTKVIPKGHHHGMRASWYGASFKLFVKEFGLRSDDKGVHDECNVSSNVGWFHHFTGNSYILLTISVYVHQLTPAPTHVNMKFTQTPHPPSYHPAPDM